MVATIVRSMEDTGEVLWNMDLLDQFTSTYGRINRLRYLVLTILTMFITTIYGLITGLIIGLFWVLTDMPEIIVDILFGLAMLPVIYISYAIVVKRLKDTNRDGFWIKYTQLYSILTVLWWMTPVDSTSELIFDVITILMGIPLGIICLFFKGDVGRNRFGPDPAKVPILRF